MPLLSKETSQILYISMLMFSIGILSIVHLTFQYEQSQKIKKLYPLESLSLAKNALLALETDLPCPDDNNDGYSDVFRNKCLSTLGWLPFKTLGLDDLRDAHGYRLWYAHHQGHTIEINGQIITSAVILAPHQALKHQLRRPPTNTLQPNGARRLIHLYLEGANADQNKRSFTTLGPILFNDQLVWITPNQLNEQTTQDG